MIQALFGVRKPLIGVVHLLPLPGSPRWRGNMESVLARAQEDALTLTEGGASGIIVENFGDVPYSIGSVGPDTVAAMTLAEQSVRHTVDLPVGVNVLRNDPHSALAIAAVTGSHFIRVNVHYGVMVADEGIVQGQSHDTLRNRHSLGAEDEIKILADVLVKHATSIGNVDIAQAARDTVFRGLADCLIVTGPSTGSVAALEDLVKVKGAVPDVPVLVGSGVNKDNAEAYLAIADGAIVGTSLKVGGIVQNPVDPERVKRLANRFKALR